MTKIVIIGGGVIGSGLAWNLAKGGAADDVVVPPVAVRRYAEVFASSDAEFRIFDPANYGLPALKHIEALSKESAPVWADLLDLPQPDLTCKARP